MVRVLEGKVIPREHVVLEVHGHEARFLDHLKAIWHVLPVLRLGFASCYLMCVLMTIDVALRARLLLLNLIVLLAILVSRSRLLNLTVLLLMWSLHLRLWLSHLWDRLHMLMLLLSSTVIVGLVHLWRLHGASEHRLRRLRLDHDLVILISVVVTDFLLIVSAPPVIIHDELILVFAWCERLSDSELMVAPRDSFHGYSLLPVAERAYDRDIVATMPPAEYMLHRLWLSWHYRYMDSHRLLHHGCRLHGLCLRACILLLPYAGIILLVLLHVGGCVGCLLMGLLRSHHRMVGITHEGLVLVLLLVLLCGEVFLV